MGANRQPKVACTHTVSAMGNRSWQDTASGVGHQDPIWGHWLVAPPMTTTTANSNQFCHTTAELQCDKKSAGALGPPPLPTRARFALNILAAVFNLPSHHHHSLNHLPEHIDRHTTGKWPTMHKCCQPAGTAVQHLLQTRYHSTQPYLCQGGTEVRYGKPNANHNQQAPVVPYLDDPADLSLNSQGVARKSARNSTGMR